MKKIVFAALLAMIMLACTAALADGMVTVELSDAGCTSAGSGVTVTSRGVKITPLGSSPSVKTRFVPSESVFSVPSTSEITSRGLHSPTRIAGPVLLWIVTPFR